MTDERDLIEEPTPEELAGLNALLARADVWDEPPPGLEDAVVAAIATEAGRAPLAPPSAEDAALPSLDERRAAKASGAGKRTRRRSNAPWWLGAAAAAFIVAGGVAIISPWDGGNDDVEPGLAVALEPAEAAGDATATAQIAATPAGLRIILDVDDLPGAPDGTFYEAWLSDGDIRISAGTFHLRNGDNPIALWAGVVDPAFNKLSVTLEPLDGDPGSSGDVRFRAEFDVDDVFLGSSNDAGD